MPVSVFTSGVNILTIFSVIAQLIEKCQFCLTKNLNIRLVYREFGDSKSLYEILYLLLQINLSLVRNSSENLSCGSLNVG